MPDHNLDDLIIDTIEPKNSKAKSFLTIIALAIVVMIVAIILSQIILKNPNEAILNEDDNTVVISPELTLQSVTQEESVKAPYIPTIEEIKPEVKLEENKKPTTVTEETPEVSKAKPIETVQITNEFQEEANARAALAAELKASEKKATLEKEAADKARMQAEENKKIEAEKIANAKAKAEKKSAPKPAEKVTKQTTQNKKITHPYFIQVGSFTKNPSERFLGVIKKSGFNYQITSPASNGLKKLLIGPYKTSAEVNNALKSVRDRINKSAFIIRK